MIVSASRRTDIPAFYAEWLLARVRAGFAYSVNPFNRRAVRVSLRAADVTALVLWSKDLSRFDAPAAALADAGHRLYFLLSLNAAPAELEPGVPPAALNVAAARRLAARFGAQSLAWRYDPILFGTGLDVGHHLRSFGRLAAELAGTTDRCILSFGCFYPKTVRNLRAGGALARSIAPLPTAAARDCAGQLAEIAAAAGMSLEVCCHPELVGGAVRPGRCIAADRLPWPTARPLPRPGPTRPGCGCAESRDIGLYDTCPHGCLYCYANGSPARARQAFQAPPDAAPVLRGTIVEGPRGAEWRPAPAPDGS